MYVAATEPMERGQFLWRLMDRINVTERGGVDLDILCVMISRMGFLLMRGWII